MTDLNKILVDREEPYKGNSFPGPLLKEAVSHKDTFPGFNGRNSEQMCLADDPCINCMMNGCCIGKCMENTIGG